MFSFFGSPFFDFEFIRILGTAAYGAAEVGECLEAASSIKKDDPERWYEVWSALATKTLNRAKEVESHADREAARQTYVRAANYFRASEFFLHCTPKDGRLLGSIEKSISAFRQATRFFDGETHLLEIPFSETLQLPGYLLLPPPWRRVGGRIPVLLLTSGFDNTQEELYGLVASGALARGYAVVTFEGPGQGIVLRRDRANLRPDWEAVTSKVLDHLSAFSTAHPELDLDLDRICVCGNSMGGYFALRAASDPRIKACISCDGFYDLFEVTGSRMPPWFVNSWSTGYISDGLFNLVVGMLQRSNFQLRWEIQHAMWAFGADSAATAIREMRRYTLKLPDGKEYLHHIRCPVFVTGAADTIYFPPDQNARQIFAKLVQHEEPDKELWIAEGTADGGLQAKVGALGVLHHRAFTWLDARFGIHRHRLVDV